MPLSTEEKRALTGALAQLLEQNEPEAAFELLRRFCDKKAKSAEVTEGEAQRFRDVASALKIGLTALPMVHEKLSRQAEAEQPVEQQPQ